MNIKIHNINDKRDKFQLTQLNKKKRKFRGETDSD